MKAKTIKGHLRWKINDWLKTIEDEEIRALAAKNTIVTGGSIVSMLLGDPVNDYDIYFKTFEAARRISEYYVAKFKQQADPTKHADGNDVALYLEVDEPEEEFEGRLRIVAKSAGIVSEGGTQEYAYFESRPDEQGQQYVESVMSGLANADDVPASVLDTEETDEKPKYRPVFLSSNAITLSHGVQLVIRFIGDPATIHKFYDFVHCTCYWQSWDGHLELPQEALEAILTKELRYVGSKYPLCSIIRIRKFVARGWTINAGQILKMCVQLQSFDLLDLATLEDQMTGVDAFYFQQVIQRLKEEQEKTGVTRVDGTYLMTIIDRMF